MVPPVIGPTVWKGGRRVGQLNSQSRARVRACVCVYARAYAGGSACVRRVLVHLINECDGVGWAHHASHVQGVHITEPLIGPATKDLVRYCVSTVFVYGVCPRRVLVCVFNMRRKGAGANLCVGRANSHSPAACCPCYHMPFPSLHGTTGWSPRCLVTTRSSYRYPECTRRFCSDVLQGGREGASDSCLPIPSFSTTNAPCSLRTQL